MIKKPSIEVFRDKMEMVMINLGPGSQQEHSNYMAGFIDGMAEFGIITEKDREILYAEYAL
jgi:hypothetical protein